MDMKDSEMIGGVAPATLVSEENAETIAEDANNTTVGSEAAGELDKLALEGGDDGIDMLARHMQVEANDWHNRVRDAVLALISDVPMVGTAISILIGLFWPATQVNIWEALKAEVTNIVRREIFEFEMRLLESDIEALERTIVRYERASLLHEKGVFLGHWITQADALAIRMRNSNNRIHLLLHIVTVAVLHMAALHERLTFGEEIYGVNNTANWTTELVEQFERYTSDKVPNIFEEWRPWRESQIEIREWRVAGQCGNLTCRPSVSHATVEDKVSGAKFVFRATNVFSTTIFSDLCRGHRTRMMNEAVADMASCMSPTFAFHTLLPSDIQMQFSPYDRRVFGQVFRGPYSWHLLQHQLFYTSGRISFITQPTLFDRTDRDRILQVTIVEGMISLRGMQFWYDHADPNAMTPGMRAGNFSLAGRPDIIDVDVRNRPIQHLHLEFATDGKFSLQIQFEDGTSTRKFGNGMSPWLGDKVACTTPSGYRLSSWACSPFDLVRFEFTPEIPSS